MVEVGVTSDHDAAVGVTSDQEAAVGLTVDQGDLNPLHVIELLHLTLVRYFEAIIKFHKLY